ncbi:MAG: phosphohydrolase [Thermovirgaceae bacterium]|nr:phosphohydrolase [Thermovirgaceae bacterium]
MSRAGIHIISHTDLDGVVSAVVAWCFHKSRNSPLKVSLAGYGDVDFLVMDSIARGESFLVLDLFCQRAQTIDEIDRVFLTGDEPVFFDHHQSTIDRHGNRPWVLASTKFCAAKVYFNWLMEKAGQKNDIERLSRLKDIVEVANDRDLWINKLPESRLWQALVTLCGPWSVLMRLVGDPSPRLSDSERSCAVVFVSEQEERFRKALEKAIRSGDDLLFVEPGALEFGDVSDFCGLVLDRMDAPPRMVAVLSRRPAGDWNVSLRSRGGFAGRVVGLLRDGKKVRGGGHDDAAALYFPPHFKPGDIRDSLVSAVRTALESDIPTGLSFGDILKGALNDRG